MFLKIFAGAEVSTLKSEVASPVPVRTTIQGKLGEQPSNHKASIYLSKLLIGRQTKGGLQIGE